MVSGYETSKTSQFLRPFPSLVRGHHGLIAMGIVLQIANIALPRATPFAELNTMALIPGHLERPVSAANVAMGVHTG